MHQQKLSFVRPCLSAVAALCLIAGPRMLAQTAAPAAPEPEKKEEVVVLTPFVVEGEELEGYQANSSLAGTRIRTDLKDIASAVTVITKQFLANTAVTGNQDLLIYTPSTEVAGMGGNFSGVAGLKSYDETAKMINPSNNNRVRGLDSADNTRDYFLTDIPWDSFNVGRIDLQRGPNSVLFGVGSPAGIINASINDAGYKTSYKYEMMVDQFGSLRNSFVGNQVLVKNTLAVRVAALDDRRKFQQDPAYNNSRREFVSMRWDPNLLGEGNHTTVRVKFERGTVDSNNPRIIPPGDLITQWFKAPYNKVTINMLTPGNGSLSTTSPTIKLLNPGGGAFQSFQGPSAGSNVKFFYTDYSNQPSLTEVAMINSGGVMGTNLQAYRAVTLPTFTNVMKTQTGGSFYFDKVLADPGVFNFYDKLLDGPNKSEWQDWTAQNIDLQQTFFNDKLAFDFTHDLQIYKSGQHSFLPGNNYSIGVEINEVLPDGTANANIGRPFVSGTDSYGNFMYDIVRKGERGIVTYDFNSADYLGKNWLTKVLGRSVLTGLVAREEKSYKMLTYSQNSTTVDYVDMAIPNSQSDRASINGTRAYNFIYYLGPTLKSATSAGSADMDRVRPVLSPGRSGQVRFFDQTWSAAATVNKTDPFTWTDFNTNQAVVATQKDNPANYVGWRYGPVNWLSASNPEDFKNLVTFGNRSKFVDNSQAFVWQGYLLGGDLVPTFGWRKDRVVNYDTNSAANAFTGIAASDFNLSPASYRAAQGQSRNWSGVYHLPKKLTSKLPGGMSISVMYNQSSNFKADAPRRNLLGNIIDNPQANTREKGIIIGFLDDRVTLRANWYKTVMKNATLAQGGGKIFGGQAHELYQIMVLGYADAAMMQNHLYGGFDPIEDAALRGWANYAYADGVAGVLNADNMSNTGAASAYQTATQTKNSINAVKAWLNMPSFMNADFYKFWNVPQSLDPAKAKASGQLHDAFPDQGFKGVFNVYNSFLFLANNISPAGSNLPTTTVDTTSQGSEFELTGAVTKNWDVSINYVRTHATRTNLDSATRAYMNELDRFFSGDAGYIRLWVGMSAYQLSTLWKNDLWGPYQVSLSSQGQSAPEVAPWRFNFVTNYRFSGERLRGWSVGGAARLEASRISGYKYSTSLGYLDVHQPIMGPQESHYDVWFGYQKKLKYKGLVWRAQLNLRNVGESTRLVASYYQPDGSLALARIAEGMSWRFTNSLEF